MVLCGLCNIFRKNNEFKKILDEAHCRQIILNEHNEKVKNAETDYNKNPSAENMLKCISATNMRNKYIQNNNIQKLNTIKENIDEDLC